MIIIYLFNLVSILYVKLPKNTGNYPQVDILQTHETYYKNLTSSESKHLPEWFNLSKKKIFFIFINTA